MASFKSIPGFPCIDTVRLTWQFAGAQFKLPIRKEQLWEKLTLHDDPPVLKYRTFNKASNNVNCWGVMSPTEISLIKTDKRKKSNTTTSILTLKFTSGTPY